MGGRRGSDHHSDQPDAARRLGPSSSSGGCGPSPEVSVRLGLSSLARSQGGQAASLADRDRAAMTVSAETGIENMGKS